MTLSGQDEPKTKAGKLAACKTLAYELFAPQTCAGGEFGKLRGRWFAPYASVRSHKTAQGQLRIVAYELRHCAGRGTVTLPGAARERIRRRRSARRARKNVAET